MLGASSGARPTMPTSAFRLPLGILLLGVYTFVYDLKEGTCLDRGADCSPKTQVQLIPLGGVMIVSGLVVWVVARRRLRRDDDDDEAAGELGVATVAVGASRADPG